MLSTSATMAIASPSKLKSLKVQFLHRTLLIPKWLDYFTDFNPAQWSNMSTHFHNLLASDISATNIMDWSSCITCQKTFIQVIKALQMVIKCTANEVHKLASLPQLHSET